MSRRKRTPSLDGRSAHRHTTQQEWCWPLRADAGHYRKVGFRAAVTPSDLLRMFAGGHDNRHIVRTLSPLWSADRAAQHNEEMVDHPLLVRMGICRTMKEFGIHLRSQQEVVHALEGALQKRRNQKLIDVRADFAAIDSHLHKRRSAQRIVGGHEPCNALLETQV